MLSSDVRVIANILGREAQPWVTVLKVYSSGHFHVSLCSKCVGVCIALVDVFKVLADVMLFGWKTMCDEVENNS